MNIKNIIQEEISDLDERRSHYKTNIDPTFEQTLDDILSKADIKDIFVSFRQDMYVTDINPKNQYNTPTGVYTYPLASYKIFPDIDEETFRNKFPYQNNLPYIVFFTLKTKDGILDATTPLDVLDVYVRKILKLYKSIQPINNMCNQWLKYDYDSTYTTPKHETHKFWLFLYDIIPYIKGGTKQTKITNLCNRIGVNGFVDYTGDGFIHSAEPKQAVFFRFKGIGDYVYYKSSDRSNKSFNVDIINKMLSTARDPQRVIDVILKSAGSTLNGDEIAKILSYSSDAVKTANRILDILGNKINSDIIGNILRFFPDNNDIIDKILNTLGLRIKNNNIMALLGYVNDGHAMAIKIINILGSKMTDDNIYDLLYFQHSDDLAYRIIDVKGAGLSIGTIQDLAGRVSDKDKLIDKILSVFGKQYAGMNIRALVNISPDKDLTAFKIIDLIGIDLNIDNIYQLMREPIDKTSQLKRAKEIIRIMDNHWRNETLFMFLIMSARINLQPIIDMLGQENMSIMMDDQMKELFPSKSEINENRLSLIIKEEMINMLSI